MPQPLDQQDPALSNVPPQNENTPPSTELTSTPPTPPIAPPTPSVTSDPVLEALVREQNRRIQELQDIVSRRQEPVAPPPNPEDERVRFYNDPTGAVRDIINNELKKTIDPLVSFVKEFRGENAYTRLKQQFAADARFSAHMANPRIQAGLDALMSRVEANEQNMVAALYNLIGLEATGQLEGALIQQGIRVAPPAAPPTPPPAPTPTPTVVNTPYIPPSAPRTPAAGQPNGQKATRQLTELEKRVARERGLTDEQYLSWLDVPANQVVHHKYGSNG